MQLLHRVAVQEQAIAADGIVNFDLAVNPLSVALVVLRPLNDNAGLASFARYLEIVGSLNRATVQFRGSSVFSMSGRDAAALNYFRHGILPVEANSDDADNERRAVVLPILLGRFAWDWRSCFPESRRGELVLELDIDIADTGYDGMRVSVETIELLGAKPVEFERKTTITQTFAATGINDVQLPLGNLIRGLLLFGTTGFGGASPAPSWGRISTLVDGNQYGFSATDFEVAVALGQLLGRQSPGVDAHTHRTDVSGVGTTTESGGAIEQGSNGWQNYCFLDFDPSRDDTFSLSTAGVSSVIVRGDAETADLVRVVQVEKVAV